VWINGEACGSTFLLFSLPTLFISECVLIYLAPEESQSILDWITANVQNTMFLLYEQILPDDTFGKVMLRNLKVILKVLYGGRLLMI
jgi:O-methyltransferase involved in polyketide biosynthesis